MKHTVYQIVYKSCYHGELYDDPRAIALPSDAASCSFAGVLEIVPVEVPDDFCTEKNRHQSNGGIGSYFADKEAAIKALREMV